MDEMTSGTTGIRDGHQGRHRAPSERVLERLLAALIERTEAGLAEWEVDEAHRESFCLVGDGWLIATRSVDGDGTYPYALLVTGPSGESVMEVVSTSAFGRPLADDFARLHAAAAATAAMSVAGPLLGRIVAELGLPVDASSPPEPG